MKKIVTLCLATVLFLPAYALVAKQGSVSSINEKSNGSFMVATNDKAELESAESEKKVETTEGKPAEEKKDSNAGFYGGVALMIAFIVIILLKTKKMTND